VGFSRNLSRISLESTAYDQFEIEEKLMAVLRKQLSSTELEGLRELLSGVPLPCVPGP
jgi:hypothetical protein